MNKHKFLTEEFYSDTFATLTALNELLKQKQVADKDMYSSGTFLFMEVYDNDESRKILSTVIKDFDEYKEYNKLKYGSDEQLDNGGISMNALQELHALYFGHDDIIMWDKENERFEFKCAMDGDD